MTAFLLQDTFNFVQISHFTTKAPPDHHIASTILDRWRQALLPHLFIFSESHVLLCDPNTSNLTLFSNLPMSSVCSFAHLNLFFLLASLRYGFFFPTLPRRPASRSYLFTVDDETGVLRVLYNECQLGTCEASVSQTRHSNVLVLLLSCALGPPTLSILVRASLHCSVKGVVQCCTRSSVSW